MNDSSMLKKRMTSACFTGHRFIKDSLKDPILHNLKVVITSLYGQGYRNFITGGALGFDTLAALAVLELRERLEDITLSLYFPCKDQTAKWKSEDAELYERIKAECDSYIYICEEYQNGCMQMRNRRMVDDSSFCIAYYEHDRGGTAMTVSYAIKRGARIYNLANLERLSDDD